MDSRRRTGSVNGSGSSYCTNCGEELSPSANFCSSCGTSCETESRPSTQSVSNRSGLEFRVTKAIENGWEVEHDFGDHVVLLRRSFGGAGAHILVGFFTVWWTGGIGNALYAAYCYYAKAQRRVLWSDEADQSNTARTNTAAHETVESSSSGNLGTTILLWLGALIMVAVAQSSATLLWTAIFTAVALTLAFSGARSLSPVRRRLEKRQSITDNGWTRTVREQSVSGSDEVCAACAGHVGRGVKRTYCKEFAVLGVPLTTTEQGTNYYCQQCANGEVLASDSDSDSGSETDLETEPRTGTEVEPNSDSSSTSSPNSISEQPSESEGTVPGQERDRGQTRQNRDSDQTQFELELEGVDEDEFESEDGSADEGQNRTKDEIDTSVDHGSGGDGHEREHEHDRDVNLEHDGNTGSGSGTGSESKSS